jgi:peptidoglycan hydrolase CwlO-like protein
MRFDLVFSPEPEPMPTVTQMPNLGPAADLSASIAGIVTIVILALGTLAWRRLSTWIPQVVADVKMTKVQTTNSHSTNLRDDITDTAKALESVAASVEHIKNSVEEMKDGMQRLDTRQTEVHEDIRETRRDLRFATEYVRDVDKRLIEHVDEAKRGDTNG